MKKLYFMLLAMFVAFTANASWTVKFTNPDGWSKVCCYAWAESPKVEHFGSWGTTQSGNMQKDGDVWVISYDGEGKPDYVIFHNGSGAQTNNLPFQAGATYNFDGVVGGDTPIVTSNWKLKGAFTDNWQLVALPYEHTFDGTQGEQQYGLDLNGNFFSGGTTFSGETITWYATANKGNDKIAANFKGTVRFSINPDTKLVTVEKIEDTPNIPKEYTIYFYDTRNLQPEGVFVHIWKKNTSLSLNGYAFGSKEERMTDTGKDVVLGDEKYPLYSYTFTTEWAESDLMGKFCLTTNPEPAIKNGGYYTNGSTEVKYETDFDAIVDREDVPTTYTIYFYDKNDVANLSVRIWDKGETHDHEAPMVSTGKYIYDGTNYWPAYVYTIETTHHPAYLRFRDITGTLSFVNNGFYTNDGSCKVNLQLVDIRTDEYVSLYMNFAEDWLSKADNSYKPHCQLYNTSDPDNTAYPPNAWYGQPDNAKEEMTNPRYQIWEFKVPADEIEKYNAAVFYFKDKEGNIREYHTTKHEDNASYDAENWTKFIYAPAVNGYNFYTRQSYLTYSQFIALDAAGRHELFLLGQLGASQLPGWDIDKIGDGTHAYKVEDGLCYIKIKLDAGSTATFKISWINPNKAAEDNGYPKADVNNMRLWATYDLGLIGVDDLSPLFADGTLDPTKIDADGNNCYIQMRNSLPYNNYNQFDWVVDTNKTPIVGSNDGNYYIVVDTHPECHTLTLIGFEPNPTISVTTGEVTTLPMTYAQGAQVHSADNHLLAAATNGHQFFDAVNIASGDVEIQASATEAFVKDFGVVYEVLMGTGENEQVAARVPYDLRSVHLDYLPAALDCSVQAVYKNNRTGLTFHSRKGTGTITNSVSLPAPTVSVETAKHQGWSRNEEGQEFHAVVMLDYDVPEAGSLAYFADFEASANDVEEPIICHKGINWVNLVDEFYYLGQAFAGADWEPCEDESNFGYSNSWSALIRDSKKIPFYLPAVQRVESVDDLQSTEVTGNVYAKYPFLVNPRVITKSGAETASRAADAVTLPEDLSGYELVLIPSAPGAFNTTILATDLTGIEDIAADTAEGEEEFFTLQGVRVRGELAPGIYIRRQGNTAEKVYIR